MYGFKTWNNKIMSTNVVQFSWCWLRCFLLDMTLKTQRQRVIDWLYKNEELFSSEAHNKVKWYWMKSEKIDPSQISHKRMISRTYEEFMLNDKRDNWEWAKYSYRHFSQETCQITTDYKKIWCQ